MSNSLVIPSLDKLYLTKFMGERVNRVAFSLKWILHFNNIILNILMLIINVLTFSFYHMLSGLMIGTDGARALKRHLKFCSQISEIEISL